MTKPRDELNSQDRKERPIFSGVLKYFPDALLEVAELSRIANEKHNPGQPLHWSKGKSNDHGDALVRHQLDAGNWDNLEGHRVRHSAEVAWRALAQLQTEIENDQPEKKSDGRIGIGADRRQVKISYAEAERLYQDKERVVQDRTFEAFAKAREVIVDGEVVKSNTRMVDDYTDPRPSANQGYVYK